MKTRMNIPTVAAACAALLASSTSLPAETNIWTGASGSDLFWSTGGNWSPAASPAAGDDAWFRDDGAAADTVTANNIVSSNQTVRSLWFGQTNGSHNTVIQPDVTLNLANTANGILLLAGTETSLGGEYQNTNTISGAGGTLSLSGATTGSTVVIRQASPTIGSHRTTVDMSGLGTLTATVGRVLIGTQGSIIRPAATWLLAQTNTITTFGAAPAVLLGDGNSNGGQATVQLGQTNAIFTDTLTVARQKSNSILQFQPALTNGGNPTLLLRSRTGDRVSNLSAGDNSAQNTSGAQTTGNIHLSGGTVDVLAGSIFLGRGQNGNGTGGATGTLTFDAGLIDANTVEAGYQTANTAVGVARGTVNVNGAAVLQVNTTLRLARFTGAGAVPEGTLNLNGGTGLVSGVISDGGGTSAIYLNSGLLDLQPAGDTTPGTVAAKTITIGTAGPGSITNASVISATTLTMGPYGSIGGTTAVDLATGATFDGSAVAGGFVLEGGQSLRGGGLVIGDFAVNTNAALSPGGDGTAGTLTFVNNTLLQSGNLQIDLSSDPFSVGGANDLLTIQGNLTLTGTNAVYITALSGDLGNGSYRLIDYWGGLGGGASNFKVTGPLAQSRRTFAFDTATGGQVNLVVGGSAPMNLTWVGDGVSNTWDLIGAANWNNGSGAAQFFNLDTVTFDDSGSNAPSVNLVGTLTFGSLTVNNATRDYTFTGPGVLDGPGALNKLGPGSLTLAGTGPHTCTGPISLQDGSLAFDRADDIVLPNALSGSGTLVQQGTNVLTLSPPSAAFDGPIQIKAGTLRAGNANALGTTVSGVTIEPGATLDVNNLNLGLEPVTVSGAGVHGAGAIVDSTASAAYNNPNLAYVTMAGDTTFGGTGRWDLRSNPSAGTNAALSTSGNAYRLTKVGTNQVAIVGVLVDPALGDIDVREGTLGIETGTTSMGDPAATLTLFTNAIFRLYNTVAVMDKKVVIQEGATFRNDSGACVFAGPISLQGSNVLSAGGTSLTLTGALSGPGQLNKIGGSPLILTADANDWSGGTVIEAGILQVGDGVSNGSLPDYPVIDNGTLRFNPAGTVMFNQSISGSGAVHLIGPGTVILTAANTYSNQTFLNSTDGGALRIAHGGALGETTGNTRINGNLTGNSRLELEGSITVAEPFLLDCRQGGTLNVPHILNAKDDNTLSGTISGTTGGSDWNIQSDTGKLTVAGDFINIAASATRNLKLSGDGDGEWSGIISNSTGDASLTAVVKNGNGIWTLSGTNAYTGPTTVNAGTLVVSGQIAGGAVAVSNGATLAGSGLILAPVSVAAGGTLSPGTSIGTMTIVGTLSLGGTNVMEVNKAGGSITCDKILGVSSLTLGGTLKLVLSGDDLADGDFFTLYTAGLRTGSFASIEPATPGTGLEWDTSDLTVDGTLKVKSSFTPPPVVGSMSLSGGNVVVTGTGGTVGGTYEVLMTTNMLTPIENWTPISTNVFGPDGSFTFTNAILPGASQQFYAPAY